MLCRRSPRRDGMVTQGPEELLVQKHTVLPEGRLIIDANAVCCLRRSRRGASFCALAIGVEGERAAGNPAGLLGDLSVGHASYRKTHRAQPYPHDRPNSISRDWVRIASL